MVLLLITTQSPFIVQKIWKNTGYIFLNHGFHSFQSGDMQPDLSQHAEVYLLRALNTIPSNSSVARGLGYSLLLQGKLLDTVDTWQQIPGVESELLEFGHAARMKKQYIEAAYWYSAAMDMYPYWRDPVYYMGLVKAEMGQAEGALSYYDLALSSSYIITDITDSEIYCALGWVYHWLQKDRDAHKALFYYDLALDEGNVDFNSVNECRFKRAEILLWSLNEFGRAVADYEILTSQQPDDALLLSNLAVARYKLTGDFITAEVDLTAVINAFPEYPWGYWRLADIYREKGILDKAQTLYTQALTLAPDNMQLQLQLDRLKKP